mgnify:CR=1 FL=1
MSAGIQSGLPGLHLARVAGAPVCSVRTGGRADERTARARDGSPMKRTAIGGDQPRCLRGTLDRHLYLMGAMPPELRSPPNGEDHAERRFLELILARHVQPSTRECTRSSPPATTSLHPATCGEAAQRAGGLPGRRAAGAAGAQDSTRPRDAERWSCPMGHDGARSATVRDLEEAPAFARESADARSDRAPGVPAEPGYAFSADGRGLLSVG